MCDDNNIKHKVNHERRKKKTWWIELAVEIRSNDERSITGSFRKPDSSIFTLLFSHYVLLLNGIVVMPNK